MGFDSQSCLCSFLNISVALLSWDPVDFMQNYSGAEGIISLSGVLQREPLSTVR